MLSMIWKTVLCLCCLGQITLSHADAGARTNVVLILIDDLNHYGVTAYGASTVGSASGSFEPMTIHTPNIDALANEGFMAANAFSYPLCENTRVALMSGKYNQRNLIQAKSLHHSDITFGDLFQRAGYKTGFFGKWKQSRGTTDIPALQYPFEFGWDEFSAFDVHTAGQRYINPLLAINGVEENYAGRTDLDPATGRRWYGPDIINRHALAFIDRHKDEPFFLYYPMLLIHSETQPTPDTVPASAFDEFPEADLPGGAKDNDDPRYIADNIAYTDKLIGRVIDKLEELGLRENTLVVVVGDNGSPTRFTHILADGTDYRGGKGLNTDNGLHVPLILNMPRTIPASNGAQYPGLTHITDILPTIADAAQVPVPNSTTLDGISFWQQALGAEGEPRSLIHHWYIGNNDYTTVEGKTEYIFNKAFKYYAPDSRFPDGRFFDLRSDPMEETGSAIQVSKNMPPLYQGLDVTALDAEQQAAYNELKSQLESARIVNASDLYIYAPYHLLRPGESQDVLAITLPFSTTRDSVVWVSSDPEIASIDKFGRLTAHKEGEVVIRAYSWSDAKPQANGVDPEFLTSGISDEVTLYVYDFLRYY